MRASRLFAAAMAVCVLSGCADKVAGAGNGRYQPSAGSKSAADTAPASASRPPSSAPKSRPSSGAPSSASGSKSPPGTHPAPAQPIETKTVHGSSGQTYVIKVWAKDSVKDCADHAYGKAVIRFLHAHPCYGMTRVLATTTVNGKPVGFAQRSIGFQGGMQRAYRTAGQFRHLVSQNGTGNLNDLMREGYRLPSGPTRVPFPNAFSALGQDVNVTVVEAWYLNGPTQDNDPALEQMAQDIYLQF